MIDLSLHAKVESVPAWKQKPNRRDLPDIDFPFGGVPELVPAAKPPRRREAPEKSEELPKSGVKRDLVLAIEQMAISHGTPAPVVRFGHREGPNKSYARVGLYRMPNGKGGYDLVKGGQSEIYIGVAGLKSTSHSSIATALHEQGHISHARALVGEGKIPEGIAAFTGGPRSYSDEQQASRLARSHAKKAFGKRKGTVALINWDLRHALGTYVEGWKTRGKPVKLERGTNKILSGGEY